MEDANIYDGDLLVVDLAEECRAGDIVLATLENETIVKRLHDREGQLVLMNECCHELSIKAFSDFKVCGKVLYSIHAVEGSASDEASE